MSKDTGKSPFQWHPLFAELLRPLLQKHFEVRTNVAVGDVPREADILLVQRTTSAPTPFRGLWRHLTTWNVVEFKAPSVSARLRDLDLLVEVGLGLDRRLNEDRQRQQQRVLSPEQVSFWYIAKDLGRRFLHDARHRLAQLEGVEAGLWRSQVLERLVFFVSSIAVTGEPESVLYTY
jgi:hypothetical protein